MQLIATLATTLALLVTLSCNTVESRPGSGIHKRHTIQKRLTEEDVLGDLTAGQTGILNDYLDKLDYELHGNCKEIYDASTGQKTSGLYHISIKAATACTCTCKKMLTVYCDMNSNLQGGGWTVISRRVNADVSFNRNWTDYRNGFGELYGNFWLGLQNIKDILDHNTGCSHQLYIGLENFYPSNSLAFSLYNSFSLGDESTQYTLTVSSIATESTAGDALSEHSGKKFFTPDNDNVNQCASSLCAGWWYINCADSHLTGKWKDGTVVTTGQPDGIIWDTWNGNDPIKTVVMAIRPVCV